MKLLMLIILVFQAQSLWAADFEKVAIPGAKCGNGSPYVVFLRKQSTEKLLVEFMGGGACWNKESCFKLPHAWVKPIPMIDSFSTLTTDNDSYNPFAHHSMVYFPYCTGDVHIGNHVATYNGKKVYHYGRRNILLALDYLEQHNLINFKSYNDVTVWGASAGAMASLIYGKNINERLGIGVKKTMIADSPGLHFGEHFWDKFPEAMKKDFKVAFNDVGLQVNFNDGLIAKNMSVVFSQYLDWNIGVLMGTQDYVMSKVFGDIDPKQEEILIMGPEGLPAVARDFPNVKVWLKQTRMHTFLIVKESAEMDSTKGESAIDFVRNVYATP
jgi:hypothetical protein